MRTEIAGREVAVDAVIDIVVLGIEIDRLRDFERAVPLDVDVAEIALDPLLGFGGRGAGECEEGGCRKCQAHVRPLDWRKLPWARLGWPGRHPGNRAPA